MNRLLNSVVLFLFSVTSSLTSFAQDAITEGKIVYIISYPGMEMDSSYKAMMPSESVVYFKDKKSRTEMSVSTGIFTASILDSRTGDIITLTDMMGTKNAIVLTEKDQQKAKKEKTKNGSESTPIKIIFETETKVVAGYTCKKAMITLSNETAPIEVFYTDQITSKTQLNSSWENFEGFPLEYTINMEGIMMQLSASSVTLGNVADSLFTIPTDYKILTSAELERMMK
jgi:GLPGLI family protein